ncbi:MAG: polysaccharide biosynthesis C-terminal domain-containing protein [Candidatus Korobacteraceae bacterium]
MSTTYSNSEAEIAVLAPAAARQSALKAMVNQILASDLARKVLETYGTQLFLILVGLITTVAVARTLGPMGRGLYAVTLAMGQIGVQFGHFGYVTSNTYYLGRNREILPRLLANSLVLSVAVGVGAAVAGGLVFYARPELAPVHGFLLLLSFLYIPLGLSFLFSENLLLALHQVRSYNKLESLNRILILILVGAVILSRHVSAQNVFAVTVVVMALSNVAAFFLLKPLLQSWPRTSFDLLREHFGLGIKAYLIIFFSYLLLRIDLLMVKYMLGPEQAGYYSVASSMADYLLMLSGVIGMILFPKLASMQDWRDKLRLSRKATYGMIAAMIPLLCVAGLAAHVGVRILFGSAFLPAAAAFIWLLPGIFTLAVETVAVQFLNAMGYPRILVIIWGISVALNVAGNLWAIPHLGISGASLMSSISYALTMVAILVIVRRTERNLIDVC